MTQISAEQTTTADVDTEWRGRRCRKQATSPAGSIRMTRAKNYKAVFKLLVLACLFKQFV